MNQYLFWQCVIDAPVDGRGGGGGGGGRRGTLWTIHWNIDRHVSNLSEGAGPRPMALLTVTLPRKEPRKEPGKHVRSVTTNSR